MKIIVYSILALPVSLGLLAAVWCVSPQRAPAYNYPQSGMMGPEAQYRSSEQRISISMDKAIEIVNNYLRDRNEPDLKASDILEFNYNFYVGFAENIPASILSKL